VRLRAKEVKTTKRPSAEMPGRSKADPSAGVPVGAPLTTVVFPTSINSKIVDPPRATEVTWK
jgi:hypothetical protein